MRKIEKGY